jgi:putative ABC transport system ATP-binding protein
MKSTIIQAEKLSRSFRNAGIETKVIREIDVSFCRGEFTVVMGNSGSGKSTLLYLLCGLDKPSSGKIWIDDQPVHDQSEKQLALLRRSKVGFVFQENNLIPDLSIRENILVAGYLIDKDRKRLLQRTDALLDDLEILPLADRMPSQVSGGELQRCAIARALINDPLVLLADEPTGSLNSDASQKVLDCLGRLHRKGQSIIMVTHDLKSALHGERILFFRDGTIMDEFRNDPESLTSAREDALFEWLKEKGW